jgi:hypothetical protein
MPTTLIVLGALGLAVWFWYDSMQAREKAVIGARAHCRQNDVQFLDDTVALGWVGLRRRDGLLHFLRVYVFEYATSGATRHHGVVAIFGRKLLQIRLES